MANTYISANSLYGSTMTENIFVTTKIGTFDTTISSTMTDMISKSINEFKAEGPNGNPISLIGKEIERALKDSTRLKGDNILGSMYDNYNANKNKSFTHYDSKFDPSDILSLADVDNTYSGSNEFYFSSEQSYIPQLNAIDGVSQNMYAENETKDANLTVSVGDETAGQMVKSYQNFADDADNDGVRTLIEKTNDYFRKAHSDYIGQRYKTIISRFHTDNVDEDDQTQTAISKKYGMSHGRNLLKRTPDESQGYVNPYCRVWTYHHQYHRLHDAIRPFSDENGNVVGQEDFYIDRSHGGDGWCAFRTPAVKSVGEHRINTEGTGKNYNNGLFSNGATRLAAYGSMYNDDRKFNNGLVNISPSLGDGTTSSTSIKHCMFSIENLAWKGRFNNWNTFDEYGLSPEQKGPLGGRIMWFPPYDIKFSENVSASWNPTDFIGRGESIFTYSNTTRSGTLSFKMLIDHPAILDYWEHRGKVNGTDDVDNVDSYENELLRFFAGCEVLKAASPPKRPVKVVPKPKPAKPKPSLKSIQFFIFYPNNYTGWSDYANTNSSVNPIDYLLNGFGSQKVYNSQTGKIEDFPTTLNEIKINGNTIGGYEIRNRGISVVNQPSEAEPNAYGNGGYDSKDRIVLSTVHEISNGSDDDFFKAPAKMVGSKALKYSAYNVKRTKRIGKENLAWYDRRWYYRVDTRKTNYVDIPNEKLSGYGTPLSQHKNYIDGNSFHLNSTGYTKVNEIYNIGDKSSTYSFAEMYLAMSEGSDYDKAAERLEGLYNKEHVNIIKKVLSGSEGKIIKVRARGWASSQGTSKSNVTNTERNNYLSKARARTAIKWVKKKLTQIGEESGVLDGTTVKASTTAKYDTKNAPNGSTQEWHAKVHRSAFVEIFYDPTQVSDTTTDTDSKFIASKDSVDGKTVKRVTDSLSPANLSFIRGTDSSLNANNLTTVGKVNDFGNVGKINATGTTIASTASTKTSQTQSVKEDNGYYPSSWAANGVRYDNEARFFEKMSLNAPILTEKLREKIMYFNPAFHSMSPEGFNARLTFLQQCMRQGPTIGGSNFNSGTSNADNLAFGRPPVCVLRIGDFYNTKIIIETMQINYDPMQWDLNEEGIGAMPMIADISITFKFIGGTDLGGPIERLQNAVSFNYYSNASVYDNRAEEIRYKEGVVKAFKPNIGQTEIQKD